MIIYGIIGFLVLVIIYLLVFVNQDENFTQPYECTHENDCFPYSYARTQEYGNVCPPNDSRLTREKKHLVQNCSKRLGKFGAPQYFNDHHN